MGIFSGYIFLADTDANNMPPLHNPFLMFLKNFY